eukprot:jgi/Bigna1/79440/fgenesh1_pg.62_\
MAKIRRVGSPYTFAKNIPNFPLRQVQFQSVTLSHFLTFRGRRTAAENHGDPGYFSLEIKDAGLTSAQKPSEPRLMRDRGCIPLDLLSTSPRVLIFMNAGVQGCPMARTSTYSLRLLSLASRMKLLRRFHSKAGCLSLSFSTKSKRIASRRPTARRNALPLNQLLKATIATTAVGCCGVLATVEWGLFERGGAFGSGWSSVDAIATAKEADNLYVKPSQIPNAGSGLYAKKNFVEGEVVCEYSGDVYNIFQFMSNDSTYALELSPFVYVDARHHEEVLGRYINDHGDLAKINVVWEKHPWQGKAFVVASRDIQSGEELYVSYGSRYWKLAGRELRQGAEH